MKFIVTTYCTLLIEKERTLDEAFVEGSITELELQQLVEAIALLLGKIRLAHLEAHLTQKNILTPHQIRKYDEFRGYHSGTSAPMHGDY